MVSQHTEARPQYAVKSGSVNCIMCHQSPAGGGPRNVYGKIYASRGLGMGKHSSTDLYAAEVRAIGSWKTEDTSKNNNGFSIMNSTVSTAVPVLTNADGTNYKAIGSYDFQGYTRDSSAELYFRHENNSATGFKPKHIIVGKFNVPFGLFTEEHRTYTKKQVNNSLNQYDIGGMISGDIISSTHYDFALTQGYHNFKGSDADSETTWSTTLNLRQLLGPMYVALSGIYTKSLVRPSPWAISLNSAINISFLSSTLLIEAVVAKNYNNTDNNEEIARTGFGFIDSTKEATYLADIANKQSAGIYLRWDFDVKKDLVAFYKLDGFAPDKNHLRDYYLKHTVGARYFINSNMDVDIRYEATDVKRAQSELAGVWASKDAVLVLAHAWF